jgi:hypothetical protein
MFDAWLRRAGRIARGRGTQDQIERAIFVIIGRKAGGTTWVRSFGIRSFLSRWCRLPALIDANSKLVTHIIQVLSYSSMIVNRLTENR